MHLVIIFLSIAPESACRSWHIDITSVLLQRLPAKLFSYINDLDLPRKCESHRKMWVWPPGLEKSTLGRSAAHSVFTWEVHADRRPDGLKSIRDEVRHNFAALTSVIILVQLKLRLLEVYNSSKIWLIMWSTLNELGTLLFLKRGKKFLNHMNITEVQPYFVF